MPNPPHTHRPHPPSATAARYAFARAIAVALARALAIALALALALAPSAALAQMAGLRTERLADGVYAIVRTTRPGDPSDANSLVIINDRDVIVVDANITPRSSRAVIAAIKRLTDKPVRYVITTHAHSDHHTGNVAYRRAYPGVEFVAHRNTWNEVLTEDLPDFKRLVNEEYPTEIRRLQQMLAKGVKTNGTPLTAEERTRAAEGVAGMKYFIEEGTTFLPIPPTLTFDDSLDFRRGDRLIQVRYLGYGNTRGDIVVHLPRERILATGDLVVSPFPFAYGAFPFAWIGTLGRLHHFPADVILPGHGEPMRDWRYVDQVGALLCATAQRVVAAGGSTVPLDTLVARVPLDDFAGRFAGGVEWMRRAMRNTYVLPALEGAQKELLASPSLTIPATCAASPQAVAPRATFRTDTLATGVYMISPTAPLGFGMDANSMVVVGPTGTLVVDAQFSASSTQAVIEAVRALSPVPVRWLVNTHWHDDHVAGNATWQRAFPDVAIIAHRLTREDLLTQGAVNRAAFVKDIPGTAAYLRDIAAKQVGIDGKPTDANEIAAFHAYATLIERFRAESASVTPIAPTQTLDEALTLKVGKRRVEVRFLGRGHTRSDVVVYLPDDGILASGDLVVWPVPFIGTTSFPRDMGATLDRMLALPHRIIMPGHGPPLRDDGYVRDVAAMLSIIRQQVDSSRAAGDSLGAVRRLVTLEAHRRRFAGDDRLKNELFVNYVLQSAIPKAFTDGVAADSEGRK